VLINTSTQINKTTYINTTKLYQYGTSVVEIKCYVNCIKRI